MQRDERLARTETPGVDVMESRTSDDAASERRPKLLDVEPVGHALEQDVRRVGNDPPGRVQDQQRDEEGERRIDRRASRFTRITSAPRLPPRAEHVAQDMRGGGAQVEAVPVARVQHAVGEDVHAEPGHGARPASRRRAPSSARAVAAPLRNDPGRDEDERKAVDEGREDLETLVAVGTAGVRGPAADAKPQQREPERGHIGQHVHGVGEQCEGAGDQPADKLRDEEVPVSSSARRTRRALSVSSGPPRAVRISA